ncbi:MAG: hypothetical protein ABEI99_01780 [Halobaculum sp.]
MPTEDRIEAAVVETVEKLERVGYEVTETESGEDPRESDSSFISYVFASAPSANFYIVFTAEAHHADIVYPYTVAGALAEKLEDDEMSAVLDVLDLSIGKDRSDPEVVGAYLIENTDEERLQKPAFNIARYGISPLTAVQFEDSTAGFPLEFRVTGTLLPYEDDFSVRSLNTRVDATLSAGKRTRRYVESCLTVETSGDPSEYVVATRF